MNLDEMIKVGMADLKVGKSPDVLTTLGLGSCVGVAIYDPVTKISGLLHCMLPDSTQFRNNSDNFILTAATLRSPTLNVSLLVFIANI